MPVLIFSYAEVKDADKFRQYIERAAALMAEQGVEVVARSQYAETLRGAPQTPHIAAVFRYRDLASAKAFYASPSYQSLVALRDEACEMRIHLYEEGGR